MNYYRIWYVSTEGDSIIPGFWWKYQETNQVAKFLNLGFMEGGVWDIEVV